MIPVKLRLKNFLSYGTAAPTLDFEEFHVACLSGRNGQGKSALLDAVTWALWGEARKSSGNRKPDEELLRIGCQEMQVEFVFDVEGDRYRVTRSYRESASGKTHTSGLELHLKDQTSGSYRPLTASAMRETQRLIDNAVGLDYDTFINSAFLLQGRSDEFTKKRPSERKEILTRILNLQRYEALADKARERGREAKAQLEYADQETERLEKSLEKEEAWQEELQSVENHLNQSQEELKELREEEQVLTERLATLKAREQEVRSLEASLRKLGERQKRLEKEDRQLGEQIDKAERLIARHEQIERCHKRYTKLQEEREELDEQRDQHAALERAIENRKAQIVERRHELEKELHSIKAGLASDQEKLEECQQKLKQEDEVRSHLEEATEAKEELARLQEVRERRSELEEKQSHLEEAILSQREALTGKVEALQEDIEDAEAKLPSLVELQDRRKELEADCERLRERREKRDETKKRGQEHGQAIREQEGQLQTYQQDLEQRRAQLKAIQQVDEDACPTCGSPLTPEHRQQAIDNFEEGIVAVKKKIEGAESRLACHQEKRDELRKSYRRLMEDIEELDGAGEALAKVREQLRAAREAHEEVQNRKQRLGALQERIETKAFAGQARAQWKQVRQKLTALSFDEEAYERVQNAAAQVERYEERWKEMQKARQRKAQLEASVEEKEAKYESLDEQLETGAAFAGLQEEIDDLEARRQETDYDPERLQWVRQELKELEGAPKQLHELNRARENRSAWQEQLQNIEARAEDVADELSALVEKKEAYEEDLENKPELQGRLHEVAEQCAELEDTLQKHQTRQGHLSARLEQAAEQRERLKEVRERQAASKSQRALYKHLKTAFSKHGIPSLIIEETLPEIEDRANRLLDRLTEGRMNVRLETLTEKKTGGTRETLDIIITDEQGVPRSYETFSGGESFRVNFALRVALAQLLAERSGVRIRTLVIDEGFGTQDEDGVQNLVEAIQTTQDDFEKILVITHLERLKEAFPVRIEVEKDPVEGSSFEVIGV